MAFAHMSSIIGAQPIATKSTTQNHNLMTVVQAYDATFGQCEFIYLKGVASTVVGSWVGYDGLGLTTLAVANGNYPLAVSMTTNTTTSSFAWYQISGIATALNKTSLTAGFLFLTSTAGSLDDASVIGDGVFNAKTKGTMAVGLTNTFNIQRPFCLNRVMVTN